MYDVTAETNEETRLTIFTLNTPAAQELILKTYNGFPGVDTSENSFAVESEQRQFIQRLIGMNGLTQTFDKVILQWNETSSSLY